MLIATPPTITVPLHTDEHGAIRVSGTHVTLDTIIARYHQGDTPEHIHEGFPTVSLVDIYAVITHYLAHRAEIDTYLKQRDKEAEHLRQAIEAQYTPQQKARTEYFKARLAKKHAQADE
jgi:uncharacterized protein (DUF433 family)